ncbi:MAG: DNA primase large subunit PriL [Euryarchaeota archaeon]|nr:DNA primase large subunit PriL [Euryarchaeota archaeon]
MGALALYAKYPVLPDARDWLRTEGPKLDALLTDFLYAQARDRARERVWSALRRNDEEDPPVFLSEVEEEMELVSHPLARMLVAAVDEALLARRFAVAESKRLSKLLEREPGETVSAVARTFDIPFARGGPDEEHDFGLHFTEYLARAPNEKAWKLVKRDLVKGHVWLAKDDFVRLCEEVYKRRLEDELQDRQGQVPTVFREVFQSAITRLKQETERLAAEYKEAGFAEVDQERFPPCIRRILTDMHNHVNIPHMGRFAVVTFLHTLGMDADGILRFFSSVPDFDPEKSRYQIEHITGKGGPTEYTPPGCGTMQTYGVCPLEERDTICSDIKHPLAYYRKALWMKERNIPMPGETKEDAAQAKEATAAKSGDSAKKGETDKKPKAKPVANKEAAR